MRIGTIIQARLSSTRLPGKVLLPVGDKPLLAYLLERLEIAAVTETTIVATSDDASDDALAAWCAARGTPCHRGPLHDVARRLLDAAREANLDAFARISGDSPFFDAAVLADLVAIYRQGDCELATNVRPYTFPRGISGEIVSTAAYEAVYPRFEEPGDYEHVTPWLYRHTECIRCRHLAAEPPAPGTALMVDTPQDLAVCRQIVAAMTRPHHTYSWREVLALRRSLPPVEAAS